MPLFLCFIDLQKAYDSKQYFGSIKNELKKKKN